MNLTAAIAGVTGLTGQSLLKQLERDKDFTRIFALSRKSDRTTSIKTEFIVTNFGDQHWKRAFPADIFFCCLGTTIKKAGSKETFRAIDYELVLQLATLARQRGCRQFVGISSLGADKNSSNFYLRTKGEMEDSVAKLGFDSCTFLRPSLLLGARQEKRTGEKMGIMLASLLGPLMLGPLKKYRAIQAETVAKAMIALALEEKPGVRFVESDDLQKFA